MMTKIVKPYVFRGVGIHSGEPSTLVIVPNDNGGIKINDIDATIENACYLDHSTGLCSDGYKVRMIEHLMAFLYLRKIRGVFVYVHDSEEMPILDGSSKEYDEEIVREDIEDQLYQLPKCTLREKVTIQLGNRTITATPRTDLQTTLKVTSTFDNIRASQKFELGNEQDVRIILNSKTFGFIEDADKFLQRGLAKGVTEENHVLIKNNADFFMESGNITAHKALDFIGDMALLNVEFQGIDFECVNPGHEINLLFAKVLLNQLTKTGNHHEDKKFYPRRTSFDNWSQRRAF